MAYGMQTYNADGGLEFDSNSFGGIPIGVLDLSTTATSSNPTVIAYTQYEKRSLIVVPLISGDYLFKVFGPWDGPGTPGTTVGDYPQISYWSANPDFSPTLSTHGFVKRPTKVLVLLK